MKLITAYASLLRAVQRIKIQGRGSNLELAAACGKDPSKTSICFWNAKPKYVARADLTLSALRWVCSVEQIPIIIPDWEALRFLRRRHLSQTNKAWRHRFRESLQISPQQLTQYFMSRSCDNSREPPGPIALKLLSEIYFDPELRAHFLEYLRYDLADYPYAKDESGAVLQARHRALANDVEKQWAQLTSKSWTMDRRLLSIFRRIPSNAEVSGGKGM